mmetsp:Transcript_27055/g.44435  ORF Transcript_27055/g.44435 Transcript_27055/m.44435 type:complete len:254 (+) Transcript_27055:17-778(+)
MANTTRKGYESVHGTNPQYIIEKITRSKIYECLYWKQHCFALTAELIIDVAVKLKYCGGTYGGLRKPSPFICLILKMLQIQPSKDIIIEFIRQSDEKYLRILGAFYLRLTGSALDIYRYLEPLYVDYRKIRQRRLDGSYAIAHVDELIDDFLHKDYVFEISLPHLTKRYTLEETKQLKPRVSALTDIDKDLQEAHSHKQESEQQSEKPKNKKRMSRSRSRSRSSSSSRSRSRNSKSRSRSRSRERRKKKRSKH